MIRKYVPEGAKLLPEEAERVFSGKIYDVYQWPQEMFDGSTETFEMLRRADTVKVVAVLTPEELERAGFAKANQSQVIITKQEQPRKDCFYDYPGGRADAEDTDELAAAKREMLEETGMSFRNWKLIRVKQPFNKIDWLVYTFLATGFEGCKEQNLDAGEKIEVLALDFDKIAELARSSDGKYLRLQELSENWELESLLATEELHRYDD